MEPEPLSIEIPGLRLAARAFGPVDGPLVLALHGWLDNALSFDGLARELPHLRIVALDLPGHGESDHHGAGYLYAFVDLVAEVFWAIEALGWSRFALLGHSLGAAIAAALAGMLPDRVVRLVMLDAMGPMTDAPEDAPIRLARALKEQIQWTRQRRQVFAHRDVLLERAKAARAMTPESVEYLMQRGIRDLDDGVVWSADGRLRLPSRLRMTEAHVLAFLRAIDCPSLLVRASEGLSMGAQIELDRVAAVRDLRVEHVLGRHHVHMDYPSRVAPTIAAFLANLRRNDRSPSDTTGAEPT